MIDFMIDAAHAAGKIAIGYFEDPAHNRISTKATVKDLVSQADKAVEQEIVSMIREKYPDHSVFAEESGHNSTGSEYEWVIDPIDGTLSFVKHYPFFSISIALTKAGKSIAGVVYAPAMGWLFQAESGKGAMLNGKSIRASDKSDIRSSDCVTGFACLRAGLEKNNLPVCNEIMPVIRSIRRDGSAALDLCLVAAGTFDVYWEYGLQPYDSAAGSLIAVEAGAVVCDMNGGCDYPAMGIVAGSPALVPQFLPYFKNKFF